MTERYNLPVYISNDSQVAALAEMIFCGGDPASNLVVLKVGRGIGAGVIINGRLVPGDDFGAGEIGHVVVEENGRSCRCGKRGCLETMASTQAVVQQARERAPLAPESALYALAAHPEQITADVLLQAWQAGDSLAQEIVLQAGRSLGRVLAYIISTLNIRRISLVGSMTRFGSPWLEAVRQEAASHMLDVLMQHTQIEISSFGADVEIMGASALLLTRELGLNLVR